MTDQELRKLIEQSFGFSDEQALEELQAATQEVRKEDCPAGNYEALKTRIKELGMKRNPSG